MTITEEKLRIILRECKRDKTMTFNVDYWDKNKRDPYEWRVVYIGPKYSPYEGGIFTVKVKIPKEYPSKRPEFFFITRIYHLNIYWKSDDNDGHVCFGSSVGNDIKELLKVVNTYFNHQNPESTWYDDSVKQSYRDYLAGKSKAFYEKAQQWVHLYAGLNQLKK